MFYVDIIFQSKDDPKVECYYNLKTYLKKNYQYWLKSFEILISYENFGYISFYKKDKKLLNF